VYLNQDKKETYSFFVEERKMRFHLKTALAEVNDLMKSSNKVPDK